MNSKRTRLHWAIIFIFNFLIAVTSSKSGAVPLDADRFLCHAIKNGEEFRTLEALLIEASAPRLRADSAVADRLNMSITYLRDETEPPTPFQPVLTRTRRYTLGYETRFSTGTSLSTELRHDSVLIDFQQFPRSEYFETYGILTLRQSLWADAFGASTRLGLEAGALLEKGSQQAYWGQAARRALDLLGLYSGTWFARQSLDFTRNAVTTRKRYLNIVETQRRRGTVNRPELLQVRSSVAAAEIEFQNAVQSLDQAWLDLAVAMSSANANANTSTWALDDTQKLELDMVAPIELAQAACSSTGSKNGSRNRKVSPAPESSAEIDGLVYQVEAARKTVRQIEGRAKPDLALTLSLSSNGIDPNNRTQTVEEFARVDNPAVTAGLGLTIPLGDPAIEAELAQARAQLQRLESQLSRARLQLQAKWRSACSDLERLVETVKMRQRIFADQNERVQALEARFRVGRSPAFDLVLAADEARGAETAFASAKRELFLTTWQVLFANEHLIQVVRDLKRQETCL